MSDNKNKISAFSFGDPTPVLGNDIIDYMMLTGNDFPYYVPPVQLSGLAKLLQANPYHGSIIEFKTNLVCQNLQPSTALSRQDFHAAVTDYNVFSNAYFQIIRNRAGQVVRLQHIPALNIRRLKKDNRFCLLLADEYEYTTFKKDEVFHIRNYDVNQNIYGVPSYIGAMQSMLLNEDATLFRRRYYKNGAHMGYILCTTGNLNAEQQDALEAAIKGSKGLGNFKNMYIHMPESSGKDGSVKILPVGDFSTRDELEKIKNLSRNDIIAAHRMPPAMASIIPDNSNGGYGDLEKIDTVYKRNEIAPVRELFLDVNVLLGDGLQVGFH